MQITRTNLSVRLASSIAWANLHVTICQPTDRFCFLCKSAKLKTSVALPKNVHPLANRLCQIGPNLPINPGTCNLTFKCIWEIKLAVHIGKKCRLFCSCHIPTGYGSLDLISPRLQIQVPHHQSYFVCVVCNRAVFN